MLDYELERGLDGLDRARAIFESEAKCIEELARAEFLYSINNDKPATCKLSSPIINITKSAAYGRENAQPSKQMVVVMAFSDILMAAFLVKKSSQAVI